MTQHEKVQHGDTIVEVMISLAVFSAVAMATINMMNSGINMAQRSLEMTMARLAIDSQVDAIEYIHSAATKEKKNNAQPNVYSEVWDEIIGRAIDNSNSSLPANLSALNINDKNSCQEAIDGKHTGAFALNPRAILPAYYGFGNDVRYMVDQADSDRKIIREDIIIKDSITRKLIVEGGLFPRLVYSSLASSLPSSDLYADTLVEDTQTQYRYAYLAENIWITAVLEKDFYDFYIQTCWNSAGSKNFTTFSTVKRFYKGDAL